MAALAVGCGILSVAAVSCGGDPTPVATPTPTAVPGGGQPASLVRDEDVARQKPGTPARSLLEFFQAVQYQDVATARGLVSKRELRRVTPSEFASAVTVVGSAVGRPAIKNVRTNGNSAIIRVFVQAFAPGKAEPVSSDPTSFQLVDQDGWKLDDIGYLTRAADQLSAARQKEQGKG